MTDMLNIKKKSIIVTAPLWKRLFAFFLDYLLLDMLVLFPFNNLINKLVSVSDWNELIKLITSGSNALHALIYTSVFMSVIAYLYFVTLEAKFGQTVGKTLLGITVFDGQKARRIGFKAAAIRNVGVLFFFTLFFITLIDVIYSFFNVDNQRFFEKYSSTRTVQLVKV